MADIIHKEATKPSEDAPNRVKVNDKQLESQDDASLDEMILEGLMDVADDAAIWVFGVGGPA